MEKKKRSRRKVITNLDRPFSLRTNSADETIEVGQEMGRLLRKGDIVALYGELGSGKTTLVKGLAKGLGVVDDRTITSPTFVIINLYKGRLPVYHIDLYRLKNIDNIYEIGYEEYFYGDGVTVIEWAEKAEPLIAKKSIRVRLKTIDPTTREINITRK